MSDPILQDLRKVPDETLFFRLVLLKKRIPTDYSAEDYVFRRDVWESANSLVREEIRRRKASPPAWWVVPERQERPRHQWRSGQFVGVLIPGALAVALFGVPAMPLAFMMAVMLSGGTWLISEIRKNQNF